MTMYRLNPVIEWKQKVGRWGSSLPISPNAQYGVYERRLVDAGNATGCASPFISPWY